MRMHAEREQLVYSYEALQEYVKAQVDKRKSHSNSPIHLFIGSLHFYVFCMPAGIIP